MGWSFLGLQRSGSWMEHSSPAPHNLDNYIIRVPLGDSCVTAAYALLPPKTKKVYIEMLNALGSVSGNLDIVFDPVDVIADFEIGLHNAGTHVFNNCKI